VPTNERYVALRYLDVGDRRIAPGEEVPVDDTWQTIQALVDGGYMVAIPASVGASAASVDVPGHDGPVDAGGAADDVVGGTLGTSDDEVTEEDGDDTESDGADGSFDPSEHTVEDVVAYVEEHLDELDAVIAAETAGRNRKTLLAQLTMN